MQLPAFRYRVAALVVCGLTATPALAQNAAPPPSQPATTVNDWLTREKLLGDWGGARTEMGNKGVKVDVDFTQFFEWAPVGDDDRGFDYGGKFDFRFGSDLSNYVAKGLSVTSHVQFRYGDTPLVAGGTLIPTSTALLFPESDGEHINISSLFGTYLFDTRVALNFGRFNTVDLYHKPFTGGEGLDKFMNLSLVAPPLSARTVPPVAEGVIVAFLRNFESAVSVGLIESTEGGFFEDGATFLWTVLLPVKPFSPPGHYYVGGEIASTQATSLDQSPWALLPIFDIPLAEEDSAWTLNFTFDQYVAHDATTKKGWGVFGMIGVSDGNPSFLDVQAHAGIGGNVPFGGRGNDTFGIGYFYNGVSNDLEDTLAPFARLRDEQGVEIYYTFAPTGWSKLTADLQLVDPFLLGSETRAFFTVRWKIEI